MADKGYYEILEVSKTATAEEIKKTYKNYSISSDKNRVINHLRKNLKRQQKLMKC